MYDNVAVELIFENKKKTNWPTTTMDDDDDDKKVLKKKTFFSSFVLDYNFPFEENKSNIHLN